MPRKKKSDTLIHITLERGSYVADMEIDQRDLEALDDDAIKLVFFESYRKLQDAMDEYEVEKLLNSLCPSRKK